MRNTIIQGDSLAVLKTLDSESVQMCVTSPPYYGLRDYQVEGQIGLEETPEAYIARLVDVFREVRRVLRNDGTLWVNIGDSYAAGKVGRTDYGSGDPTSTLGPKHDGLPNNTRPGGVIQRSTPAGYKPKDLIGIPWMTAFALRADGYYLRSEVIWHKPNCMPESVTDRPTKAHEQLFLFAKSSSYYYDADAIRETHKEESIERTKHSWNGNRERGSSQNPQTLDFSLMCHPNGRNKRSVWTITANPYPESHFATFPPKLIEPCILAGSRPGDIVLDCFMGAGTTALVASQLGRDWLGCELNPEYIEMAMDRIATVQPRLWEVAG